MILPAIAGPDAFPRPRQRKMKTRVETEVSRTAEVNCAFRAASFFESDPRYHADDFIAPRLLPGYIVPFVRFKLVRRFIMRNFSPPGIYEYIIARTKYFDEITEKALAGNFKQILILGAGFDSRAIRFGGAHRAARFYELDAYHTQRAKQGQLKKRNIDIPANLVFVTIDFKSESLGDKLGRGGLEKGEKSLFILEGLLNYLDETTAEGIWSGIKDFSPTGSWVICDFIFKSVLRRENRYYGEAAVRDKVNKYNEAWKFGIEEEGVDEYFEIRGFKVLEMSDSRKMEKRYFHGERGDLINGTHGIAWLEIR